MLAALLPAQAPKQVLFPRHFQNQEALEMKEKCFANVHLPKKSDMCNNNKMSTRYVVCRFMLNDRCMWVMDAELFHYIMIMAAKKLTSRTER